jgi:phospholipase/lecithinase/hemolysin
MRTLLARLAVCFTCLAAPVASAPFSALYVFGDSLSDIGNVFISTGGLIPASPYFNGRFSNGPNWIDDLAPKLGLGQIAPALAGGTDFAFGGAVTGPAVPGGSTSVPNLTQQAGLFTLATGGTAPASALYAVWIGANDVFAAIDAVIANKLTPIDAGTAIIAAANTAAGVIQTLASEGAHSFLIPLLPDIGKTPDAGTHPALIPLATSLSSTYNQALRTAIQALESTDGISARFLDIFALIDTAVADPAGFGFTNVTDRCYVGSLLGGGTVCASPDAYLFWDIQHPTATTHALIADFAAAAVLPEPAGVTVLLTGLLAVVTVRIALRR